MENERTPSGAYVPTKWLSARCQFDVGKLSLDNLSADLPFDYPSSEVGVTIFQARNLQFGEPDLALHDFFGFEMIGMSGGYVKLPSLPKKMTMSEIQEAVRTKERISVMNPPKPHIASAELKVVRSVSNIWRNIGIGAGIVATCILFYFLRRTSKRTNATVSLFALFLPLGAGCGHESSSKNLQLRTRYLLVEVAARIPMELECMLEQSQPSWRRRQSFESATLGANEAKNMDQMGGVLIGRRNG